MSKMSRKVVQVVSWGGWTLARRGWLVWDLAHADFQATRERSLAAICLVWQAWDDLACGSPAGTADHRTRPVLPARISRTVCI